MKLRSLIELLSKYNPESEVSIGAEYYDSPMALYVKEPNSEKEIAHLL